MTDARGAIIEIIERRKKPEHDSIGASIVVPNDVRINGQSLACSADDPVIVHEVSSSSREVVKVTLTLFAQRVFIGHEEIDANLGDLAAAQQELLDAQRAAADSARDSAERLKRAYAAVGEAQHAVRAGGKVAERLQRLGLLPKPQEDNGVTE